MTTEKLRKLKALADRGEAKERIAAQRLLEQLMEKYDIQLDSLAEETSTYHDFSFSDKLSKKLLLQICAMVLNSYDIEVYKGHKSYTVLCTDSQATEIAYLQKIYQTSLKKHIDNSYTGFLIANHLFPKVPSEKEFSENDKQIWEKASLIASVTDRTPIYKAIGQGGV